MREINQPYHGTLSSYSYTLLVIHYLQQLTPAVLPILQDEEKLNEMGTKKLMVDGFDGKSYDCTFYEMEPPSKSKSKSKQNNKNPSKDASLSNSKPQFFVCENRDNIGKLLVGFFKYYGYTFDFEHNVVCIRKLQTVTKQDKDWDKPTAQNNYMCIEDPFETHFNVARTCREEGIKHIKYEFIRAYHLLCNRTDLKTFVCGRLSNKFNI